MIFISKRIGNPDSKYTYCPERLEQDIMLKNEEHEAFKRAIKQLILNDPSKLELRYKDAIEALIELKKDYCL